VSIDNPHPVDRQSTLPSIGNPHSPLDNQQSALGNPHSAIGAAPPSDYNRNFRYESVVGGTGDFALFLRFSSETPSAPALP
jgi:hypothetical protein